MAEKKNNSKLPTGAGVSLCEQSYRMAKLLRAGNRELERQLNTKKTKRVR